MNSIDSTTLKLLARWYSANPGQTKSTDQLAHILSIGADALPGFAESLHRLVQDGYVAGHQVTSHSSSHREYLIQGPTSRGLDAAEQAP